MDIKHEAQQKPQSLLLLWTEQYPDRMEGFHAKKEEIPFANSQEQLATIWRRLVPSVQGRRLAAREMGQLKMLEQRLGYLARPVMAYAVKRWSEFSNRVEKQTGMLCSPAIPHIGFLLGHCELAGTMFLQTIRYQPPPYKPSPEEIERLLNEFRQNR